MQNRFAVLGVIVVVLLLVGGGLWAFNTMGNGGDGVQDGEPTELNGDNGANGDEVSYTVEDGKITLDWGEKPTGGYKITIEDLQVVDNTLVVDYSLVSPAPDDIVTQAITYPEDSADLPEDDFEDVELINRSTN